MAGGRAREGIGECHAFMGGIHGLGEGGLGFTAWQKIVVAASLFSVFVTRLLNCFEDVVEGGEGGRDTVLLAWSFFSPCE